MDRLEATGMLYAHEISITQLRQQGLTLQQVPELDMHKTITE
jgi:hypothetical protein